MKNAFLVFLFLLPSHIFAEGRGSLSQIEEDDICETVYNEGKQIPLNGQDTLLTGNNDTLALLQSSKEHGGASTKPRKKGNFLKTIFKVADAVTDFFMGCDTNYVTPQKYELTAQAELSYWHDYYRITSSKSGNNNSMSLESGNPLVLGGYVYWSIFGYGHSINLGDIGKPQGETNGTGYRNSFTLNTARIFAEIYTFRSGKSARFVNISGVDLDGRNKKFKGLNSKCFGFDAQYIFNHRRYSWPAAFGENAVQRRSCGSWKLGFSYNHVSVTFNSAELSDYIAQQIDTTLLFNKVGYTDYSISFGYGYNWAFRKNCIWAVSVLPSLGYRQSNITEHDLGKDILRQISTDLVFRTSLFWNNTKYFSGIVLDVHTYSYHEKKFSLTNNYGTVKFIVGFDFLKKSQYK